MFSRKNDGTVKMTRQPATSNPAMLGMTGSKRTIADYLETGGAKTPREISVEQELALSQAEGQSLLNFHIRVEENPLYRLFLFYSSGKQRWIFYEQDLLHSTHRRSIVYSSRKRAVAVWKHQQITFFHKFPLTKIQPT